MLKLLKHSVEKTNNCIILATPLIIFVSILNLYANYLRNSIHNVAEMILSGITLLVAVSGCLAAWFYMVKKALKLADKIFVYDSDRAKALWDLFKSLPEGIGKLFLPFLEVVFITFIIGGAGIYYAYYTEPFEIIRQIEAFDFIIENNWDIFVFIVMSCISFWGFLWIPEIVYAEKNAFKALVYSIKKIFITFPKTLGVYLYVYTLYIIITCINAVLMHNPFLYFFVLILHYYLTVYIVVVLFSYYEQTFIK